MDNSSWTKPAASMRAPRPTTGAGEDHRDAADEIEIAAVKAKAQATIDADKIGKLWNASYFWTDWTFPFLRNEQNQSMSVTRFYPEAAVCVDMFTHITDHEQRIIDLKRRLFKENPAIIDGKERMVRYGALDWSMPLADLLPQLGDLPTEVKS